MTRICVLIASLAVISGCGKDETGGDSSGKPTEKAEKPKPFTGKLTAELIQGFDKSKVKPFDKWDEKLAFIESKLGKATGTIGDEQWWAVVDGEKCIYFNAEKMKDDAMGVVVGTTSGGEVDKAAGGMFKTCAEGAGVEVKEEDLDPNAPGPPEDGSPVTAQQVLDGVKNAKSKWLGKKVTMKGFYVNDTKTSSNGKDSWAVSIAADKENLTGATVGCSVGAEEPRTKDMTQKDEVTVEGTVTDMFDGHLDDCVVK